MVFPSLLSASSERDRHRHHAATAKNMTASSASSSTASLASATSTAAPEFILEEEHLQPLAPQSPDLRELNTCLEALAAVFPDIQIHVFREMLVKFDGESRLALVADTLLKNRVTWVQGRWRVPDKDRKSNTSSCPGSKADQLVPRTEVFRSDGYKLAAETLAWHEFKGLSRSTIKAVLAESNYSYLEARRTLVHLSSRSWRFALSALIFMRKKPLASTEPESHPLVVWKSSGRGSIVPSLRSTGNAELDRDLFYELILPLKEQARLSREAKDYSMAVALNNREAELAQATIECACCYSDCTFEELTSCNAEGHMVCFRCVRYSISEAIFGQGWQRSIDTQTGTLRCPAVDSKECTGSIPQHHMHRAMLEEKKGAEIMHKLEQRLADHSLLSSNLPLVRCPFCSYAEIDDIYIPAGEPQSRLRGADSIYNIVLLLLVIGSVPFILPFILLSSFLALLLSSHQTFGDRLIAGFRQALVRHRRRRRGLRFKCQNPECDRASCLSCNKEWVDVHVCNESSLVALRTQVEQAMSMAIKRVCPRCNTSFVKNAGCNKLTCPCGYKMCYVCRKDIGGGGDSADVGYRHFCQHFRPEGDPKQCTECKKCNLWESENTDQVLQQAKEEAEKKWRETEKRELSGAERVFLETGLAAQTGSRGVENALLRGRWPTITEFCDMIVENIYV
ncbi:hypothetical protein B0T22DRAFT_124431 [Podospora appendiculata]|uniref:RING-type domain-containing protein n=1 Tax=Podospora appendiculata TaxID=314037 RepID=A0AAE0X7I6_9PEZI|nr:hypothetical protein B0T22DRAFT_124431 [Podospora appendiculata]